MTSEPEKACTCTFSATGRNFGAGFTPLGHGRWRCAWCQGALLTEQLPHDFRGDFTDAVDGMVTTGDSAEVRQRFGLPRGED